MENDKTFTRIMVIIPAKNLKEIMPKNLKEIMPGIPAVKKLKDCAKGFWRYALSTQ